jgi:uncharacterized protein YeeX (DUF496 family)
MRYLVIFLFLNLFCSSIYALPGNVVSKNESEGTFVQNNRNYGGGTADGSVAEDSAKALNNDGRNDAAQFESYDEQGNDPIKSNLRDLNSFERGMLYLIFKMAISGFPITSEEEVYFQLNSTGECNESVDQWARGLLNAVADNDKEMKNIMQMALILNGHQLIRHHKSIYELEDIKLMLGQGFDSAKDFISNSAWLAKKKENFSEKAKKIIDAFNESIDEVRPDIMHILFQLMQKKRVFQPSDD